MKGSCLCQAVQYSVESLAGPIPYCHCEKCRKAHAAPFNATAGADRAGFRWVKGEEHLGRSNPHLASGAGSVVSAAAI